MPRLGLSSDFSRALRRLFHGAPNRRARRQSGRKATPPRLRPYLEALEDRFMPATFTPTTFADDGTAGSLRGVLTQANNDNGTATDTIQLQAGTYKLTIDNVAHNHDVGGTQGDLNITSTAHALVIQGTTDAKGNPTTTIQQTVLDRVFQIVNPDTTVTFKDLVIVGGQAVDDGSAGAAADSTTAEGGGILDDGGNVTLANVVLQNNSAKAGAGFDGDGGGIFAARGGSLTLQSSVVEINLAVGGAAGAAGNQGNSGEGGGIYAACPLTITESSVSGNVATGGNADNNKAGGSGGEGVGGGVFALGPTTITHSSLSSNTANGGAGDTFGGGAALGGGIFTDGETTITASTLSGNTLRGGSSSGGIGGGAFGGGVYAERTTTITASTLSGNTLIGSDGNLSNEIDDGGNGGGDAAGGGVVVSFQVTATITDSVLSGNILTGGNGSINNSKASIKGDVGGHAQGGSVYAQSFSRVTISNSTLSGNKLTGGNGDFVSGTVQGGIGGSASGGGLYASDAALTITASTLSGNTVTGGSARSGHAGLATPGTAQGGGAAFVGGTNDKIATSTIANNQAIGDPSDSVASAAGGGGLFFGSDTSGDKPTATLTNATVAGNKASLPQGTPGSANGGGIDNDSGAVTLVNTLVALNSAITGPDYYGAAGASSGHNLIGIADGSTGFSVAHGDLLGTTANPLDPHLGLLQSNGGPTPTLALLPASPAVNAGDNRAQSVTGPFDQRGQGFARVVNGTIDIGAFELQPPPSSPPPSSPPSSSPPTLHTPSLLAFFDALLQGIETVNGNGTETVTDSLFGIPLFISTYDGSGNLTSVTFFGINVTALFEL